MHPDYPADIYTCTSSYHDAYSGDTELGFAQQNLQSTGGLDPDVVVDAIPSGQARQTARKTPFGERKWIVTSLTDSI